MLFFVFLASFALASLALVLLLFFGRDGTVINALLIVWLAFGAGAFAPHVMHARDIGTISAQAGVVAVHQQRVNSLNTRLNNFEYPAGALMNQDTPVAAIVKSLTEAERDLAVAKAMRAVAIRSVERRRAGPFSGVIWFAGDYK